MLLPLRAILVGWAAGLALAVASACGSSESSGGSGGSTGGSSFACGAVDTCQPGQYCESLLGGICGGMPPDDAGSCPPNCSLGNCGSGQDVCLCTGYSCKKLPAGCTSCACLTSCGFCSQGADGGLYVQCAMP